MATKPTKIASDPGVKRDGTRLEGSTYADSQWCRWHRGLPRKIWGYRSISNLSTEKVYGMHAFVSAAQEFVHLGNRSKLLQQILTPDGILSIQSDRTPATLTVSDFNNWQFDILYDSVSASNRLIAHAAASLNDISSSVNSHVFYGDVTATGILVNTAVTDVSGGIVATAPYLWKFGNDGQVDWSVANKPNDFTNVGSGTARVTGSKIVRGMQLRGNGNGPAALFWSLDSLCRATFIGGTAVWAFDTLSDETSVLSSNGIVEYDGVYYWAGVDRFMQFNGVVRELPNQMSLNWFYDDKAGGLNYAWRQKVFAFKIPRWGEIWWCYPRGTATECTHAVIYNVRENSWYDTKLPAAGRSSAFFSKVYEHPLMMGVDLSASNYKLWKHEEGLDAIDGASIQPIQSYYETGEISMITGGQNAGLSVTVIEPDFVQLGDMSVTVRGRANSRSPQDDLPPVTFPAVAATAADQTVKVKAARRLMSFKFESNTLGGDYQAGDTYAHLDTGDGRITS